MAAEVSCSLGSKNTTSQVSRYTWAMEQAMGIPVPSKGNHCYGLEEGAGMKNGVKRAGESEGYIIVEARQHGQGWLPLGEAQSG